MTAATFEARLRHLQAGGYPVLPLGEALRQLRAGTLPARAVAVTIDDGFYTTLSVAAPLLQRYRVPATLYLTTYYVVHQDPIFNLALGYLLLWRANATELDLTGLGLGGVVPERVPWAGRSPAEREEYAAAIVAWAAGQLSRAERRALLAGVAERVGVGFDAFVADRQFALVNEAEAAEVQAYGIALGLHTHRHRSPGEESLARRELVDNAAVLGTITDQPGTAFCYPSGRYDRWRGEWLAAHGVTSATTCELGMVDADTPPFAIPRFLDGEHVHQVEFEAEMSGVLELARQLVARFKKRPPTTFVDDPAEGRQVPRGVSETTAASVLVP
jgi:peptidoglycan/xylan/chitin deacetylase (PgdA/CDA1 family)